MDKLDIITILGPTACGKTTLAVALAGRLGTEIISADSRQVYRSMDLGTGKDLNEYFYHDIPVPYHLIDVVEAGSKYNLFEYQRDFLAAYNMVRAKNKIPVLCGGTGLYLESVLSGYHLLAVPENAVLRESLKEKTLPELTTILSGYKKLHNTTDVDNCKRAIRAIEIEEHYLKNGADDERCFPQLNSLLIGIDVERELRRTRISQRLRARLKAGLIDEVDKLLKRGIAADDLIYYGLEYKYVTLYLTGSLDYDDMVNKLEVSIHQFAKRQMTWFRGMERRGFTIHWVDGRLPEEEKVDLILTLISQKNGC